MQRPEDWFENKKTATLRFADGKVAVRVSHWGMFVYLPVEEPWNFAEAPLAVVQWVDSIKSMESYAECVTTFGDLLVWASRKEAVRSHCPECERYHRVYMPQRIHDQLFDRVKVLELLQPWVQMRVTASQEMILRLYHHSGGALLVVNALPQLVVPGAYSCLMSVAVKREVQDPDPFGGEWVVVAK